METNYNSETLEKKIQEICDANEEIIQRINKKKESNGFLNIFEYIIRADQPNSLNHPSKFNIQEIEKKCEYAHLIENWKVPTNFDLPEDPDPDETLYGKHKDIMNMSCDNFSDLIRINKQVFIAKKYTSMLRESISVKYGLLFKRNFELVQNLLRNLETELNESKSTLQEKQDSVNKVNLELKKIFEDRKVFRGLDYYFENKSKVAQMQNAYVINKGTLLSEGTYRWKVKCENVVAAYDLGVASVNHKSHFGNGTNSAWGIRNNGYIFPTNTHSNTQCFKNGDILSFSLDCEKRTLRITINEAQVVTIPDVILPVHVAFSGSTGAKAVIID